jgi:hypothetical protein
LKRKADAVPLTARPSVTPPAPLFPSSVSSIHC